MRIYRDTRFARDAAPYKTNVGIQFRHEQGRDIHAPGYYVHIAPGECFLALGLWRPEPDALSRIRQAIVESPEKWKRARDDRKFRTRWTLDGGSLKRPPRGFPADNPYIEDVKRTDFIAVEELEERARARQEVPRPRRRILRRRAAADAVFMRGAEGGVLSERGVPRRGVS